MAERRKSNRRRTAMSCERCKSRKIKCNNPTPGPCDHCRDSGVECQIDSSKRRQRPYYFVSEEEFRDMQMILKRYLPNTDLTRENLHSLAKQCSEEITPPPPNPTTSVSISPMLASSLCTLADSPPKLSFTEDSDSNPSPDDALVREVFPLYQKLGCLIVDSRGEYRFMGAESGLPFNSAIRCYKNDTLHTPETPDVIPGMVTVAMPVPSQVSVQDEIQLPSQEAVHQSAMRYFEEVHSIYWLYSSEKFYSKLEETYRMPHQKLTASWSCSLYSILAIANNGSPYPDGPQYNASPNEYLLCAKSLILSVCDEGSLDSVKAMILLATAMQSHGFSNAAYLYSGLAVQIACSMGLHCDKYCISYGGVEKEHARRTWWALFMFDQDLSLRLGRPSAIEDSSNPPLPSERILPSGPYSPPSYLASYVTLCKLARNVRSELYKSPTLLGQQLKMKIVDGVMTALQDWADTLPPHLNFSAPAAPFFRRPIAALHLKYHSIQLLICRPFLFYSLLCRKQSPGSAKLQGAEKFSAICLDSSERMLGILQTMVADGLHSRQIALDFYYALDILQVFLSEFAVTKAEKQLESIRQSMKVLQSIGSAGYGEKMISEVHFQLMEWGVLSNSSNTLDSLQGLDTLFPALHSVSDFYDLLFCNRGISIDDAPNAMFPDIDTSTDLVGEAMMRDILQGPVQ